MDILTIYAIAVGGIFTSLIIIRVLNVFAPWGNAMNVFIYQHLAYPYVLRRHSRLGPWTRAGVSLHLIYLAVNLLLLFFNHISMAATGRRAGTLSLLNMIFLLASWHLSNLADIFGISLRIYRRMHRAAGWMVVALVLFHVFAMLQGKIQEDQGMNTGRLSAIIVCKMNQSLPGSDLTTYWYLGRWVSMLACHFIPAFLSKVFIRVVSSTPSGTRCCKCLWDLAASSRWNVFPPVLSLCCIGNIGLYVPLPLDTPSL